MEVLNHASFFSSNLAIAEATSLSGVTGGAGVSGAQARFYVDTRPMLLSIKNLQGGRQLFANVLSSISASIQMGRAVKSRHI